LWSVPNGPGWPSGRLGGRLPLNLALTSAHVDYPIKPTASARRRRDAPPRMYGRAFFVWGVAHGLAEGRRTRDRDARASASRRALSQVNCSAGFVATEIIAEMGCAMVNRGDSAAVSFGERSSQTSAPVRVFSVGAIVRVTKTWRGFN
jgi:hypothetical protein